MSNTATFHRSSTVKVHATVLTCVTIGCSCLAAAGCDGSYSAAQHGVITRDSAGIRIVENANPALGGAGLWTVATAHAVEIGADENDTTQTLDQVGGAVRLDNGRIVVANAAAPSLRWFDSRGNFLIGKGRYGQGPGEFDGGEGSVWIYAVWALSGDSVGTWEHSRRRLQVFDTAGTYRRTVVLDLPPDMHALSYPQIVGRLDDGFIAMLLDHNEDTAPMNVVRRDSAAFLLYDATGRYVKQIARLPGFMRYVTEIRRPGTGRTFRASLSLPYGTPFVYATHGNELVYGAAERYEIAVYDSSGSVRMLIRRAATRGPIDGELVEKYRASRLAAAGDDVDRRRDIEAQLQNLPYPDSLPSYRRFKVDREGMIWVQEYYVAGTAQASWSVFDGEGRWQTDVVMPTSWQIVDIGHDYVLTVETSEMDVERVRLHVLSRGRER